MVDRMTTLGPADLSNEDWLKRTWDVRMPSGDLVMTLAELRAISPGMTLAQLRALPSIAAAPEAIRRELGLA